MKILLETSFSKFNPNVWYKNQAINTPAEEVSAGSEETAQNTEPQTTTKNYPAKDAWEQWGEWLKTKLETNAKLSDDARQSEKEILDDFFKKFFNTNFGPNGEKLYDLERLRELFIKKDGTVLTNNFSIKRNQFLSYLTLNADKLNKNNYMGILVAFAKKYVNHNEFDNKDVAAEYNLLYCPLLYQLPSDKILNI